MVNSHPIFLPNNIFQYSTTYLDRGLELINQRELDRLQNNNLAISYYIYKFNYQCTQKVFRDSKLSQRIQFLTSISKYKNPLDILLKDWFPENALLQSNYGDMKQKSVNRNKRPCDMIRMMQPVVTWTHWNISSDLYKMLIWKNIFEKKLMAQSGSICSIFSFGTFKSPKRAIKWNESCTFFFQKVFELSVFKHFYDTRGFKTHILLSQSTIYQKF